MHSFQYRGIGFDSAQEGVAGRAEQLPDCSGLVAVVDQQLGLPRTYSATGVLSRDHAGDVSDAKAVVLAKRLAPIDRRSERRIFLTPALEARIALGSIVGAIRSTPAAVASSAIRSKVRPRLRERGKRQRLSAIDACFRVHASIIAGDDKPCHAGVLLEIANR